MIFLLVCLWRVWTRPRARGRPAAGADARSRDPLACSPPSGMAGGATLTTAGRPRVSLFVGLLGTTAVTTSGTPLPHPQYVEASLHFHPLRCRASASGLVWDYLEGGIHFQRLQPEYEEKPHMGLQTRGHVEEPSLK